MKLNPTWRNRISLAALAAGAILIQGCVTHAILAKADTKVEFQEPLVSVVEPDGSVSSFTSGDLNTYLFRYNLYHVSIPKEAIISAVRDGANPQALKWSELEGVVVTRIPDDDPGYRAVRRGRISDDKRIEPEEPIPIEIDGQTVLISFAYSPQKFRIRAPGWYAAVPLGPLGDAGFTCMLAGMIACAPVVLPLGYLTGVLPGP